MKEKKCKLILFSDIHYLDKRPDLLHINILIGTKKYVEKIIQFIVRNNLLFFLKILYNEKET